jgi:hypothetical protein
VKLTAFISPGAIKILGFLMEIMRADGGIWSLFSFFYLPLYLFSYKLFFVTLETFTATVLGKCLRQNELLRRGPLP